MATPLATATALHGDPTACHGNPQGTPMPTAPINRLGLPMLGSALVLAVHGMAWKVPWYAVGDAVEGLAAGEPRHDTACREKGE